MIDTPLGISNIQDNMMQISWCQKKNNVNPEMCSVKKKEKIFFCFFFLDSRTKE